MPARRHLGRSAPVRLLAPALRAVEVFRPCATLWVSTATTALTLISAAGCAGHSSVERGIDQSASSIAASFAGSVTEERNYVLPVDGIIDIDLETFGGDVVIRSGRETKNEIRMRVVVTASHGADRTDEATSSLAQIAVKAEIRRGGDVPTLVLRGTTEHDEAWLHETDIDIELPELRRVHVKTRSGKVHIYENRGACSVETSDGDIRMITPWAITEDVTLVTRGGEIVFRAFTGTCGIFDIDCVNGKVLTRVEAGDWRVVDPRNDHDTLHATLGPCKNKILIRNVDAPVTLSIVPEPMEYGSLFSAP